MNLDEKKAWLELYNLADEAYEYSPWEYVKEDMFLSFIDENDKMWYASVLGNNKKFYGILFIEEKDINRYLNIYKNNYSNIQTFNYQVGLMVSFVDKKNLKDDELHLLKELGINFSKIAIKFQKFERGYMPYMIKFFDVLNFSYLFKNFMVIFKHLKNKNILLPNDGEMLSRFYLKDENLYKTANIKFFKKEEIYDKVLVDDFKLISKSKPIDIEFEFINYLPIAIGNNYEDGKYKLDKFFAIADASNNKMLKIEIIDTSKYKNELEYNKDAINKLIEFINNNFIPRRIIVRDLYSYNLLKDFERISKIELKIDKIRVIDIFIDSFLKGK